MKNFNFTLWAVANVDRDTAIVRIQFSLLIASRKLFGSDPGNGTVFQIQNIKLNIVQQAVRRNIRKRIHIPFSRGGDFRKQINIVASELAPRGKQRVRQVLNPLFIKKLRRVFTVFKQRHRAFFKETFSLTGDQP